MIKPYIEITYGELLSLFRKKNKLTIKTVAEKLKVTPETIKHYEKNQTFPSFGKMLKFEELYGREFKTLSVYLRSEDSEKVKKNADPLRLRRETPKYIFKLHGCFSDHIRGFRNPRKYQVKMR